MNYKSQTKSAFKIFLEENKSLTYMLPILGVLIIVLILVYANLNKTKDTSKDVADLSGQRQVEVLPQLIRTKNEDPVKVKKNPFESPMQLKGIIYSEDNSVAILESDGVSFIAELNSTIGDTNWKVVDIEKESVTIKSNHDSITLKLSD